MPTKNLHISDDDVNDLKSLTKEQQWKVSYLTNKRLGRMLKANVKDEFFLGAVIREYTEMIILKHKELEISPYSNNYDMFTRSYRQYQTKKGGIL